MTATDLQESIGAIWARELAVPQVGPTDDFFRLGGTSLAAAQVVARVRRETGAVASVGDLLRAPQLAAFVRSISDAVGTPEPDPLPSVPDDAAPPATVQQQAVWYLEQLDPAGVAYANVVSVELTGALDEDALRAAIGALPVHQALLRTAFPVRGGGPVLARQPRVAVPLAVLEVPAGAADATATALARRPFDLLAPPLLRWTLLRHGPDRHTLVLTEHHFVHDGWSLWRVLTDLATAYRERSADGLRAPAHQYADYAQWQHEWLAGAGTEAAVDFWSGLLADPVEPVRFAGDAARPATFSFRGATVPDRLPEELTAAVRQVARDLGTTPFTVLQAGFAALVGAATGADSFNLGSMLRNRALPGTEDVVGMFVNTIALPVRGWADAPATRLATDVGGLLRAAERHQELPFPLVARRLRVRPDPRRNALFQVCFSMNDVPVAGLDLGPGLSPRVRYPTSGGAKFDLDVVVVPEPDGWLLLWRYCADLFAPAEVGRLAGAYRRLLAALPGRTDVPLGRLAGSALVG